MGTGISALALGSIATLFSNGVGSAPRTDASEAGDALASQAGLAIEAGGIGLRLKAPRCERLTEGLSFCNGDVSLLVSIADEGLEQSLRAGSIVIRDDALLHHGPLHADAKPDAHTFVVGDVNSDGRDDLLVWSGFEGAYGGPSFDVHLFDPQARRFVFSRPFSDLTIGYLGLFSSKDGLIEATTESGCCLQVQEIYIVKTDRPQLVERITTEVESGGRRKVRHERMPGGVMEADAASNTGGATAHGSELRSFVQGETKIIALSRGDIDADGREDAVLAVDESTTDVHRPRSLLLLVRGDDGVLRQAARNDRILPCRACGGALGEPWIQLHAGKGMFELVTEGGTGVLWSNEYRFEHQNGGRWKFSSFRRITSSRSDGATEQWELTADALDSGIVDFVRFDPEAMQDSSHVWE